MSIYKPTRLYIKRHSVTGLRYFGKSTRKNIKTYTGSGKYWSKHIKKHSKEHVVTEWTSDWFTIKEELISFALSFSEIFDIVNNDKWANLIPENGLDGADVGHTGHKFTDNQLNKISTSAKKMWQNPQNRAKIIDAQKASWTDNRKLAQANRLSGKKRPEHSIAMLGRVVLEDTKQKMKKPKCEGHGTNVSKALKGIPKTKDHKRNISIAKTGKKTKTRKIQLVSDHQGNIFENPRRLASHYNISACFFNDLDKPIRYSSTYKMLGIEYTDENKKKTKKELGFTFLP